MHISFLFRIDWWYWCSVAVEHSSFYFRFFFICISMHLKRQILNFLQRTKKCVRVRKEIQSALWHKQIWMLSLSFYHSDCSRTYQLKATAAQRSLYKWSRHCFAYTDIVAVVLTWYVHTEVAMQWKTRWTKEGVRERKNFSTNSDHRTIRIVKKEGDDEEKVCMCLYMTWFRDRLRPVYLIRNWCTHLKTALRTHGPRWKMFLVHIMLQSCCPISFHETKLQNIKRENIWTHMLCVVKVCKKNISLK